MNNPSFASRWNVDEIDDRYSRWLLEPASLEPEWQYFFEGFHLGADGNGAASAKTAPAAELASATASVPGQTSAEEKHARLYGAIYAFRSIGHTQGTFNPLNDPEPNPRLSLERLGFDHREATPLGPGGARLDIPTIVCGPGFMDQGHKPDEFISLDQLASCDRMLAALNERLVKGL